MLAQTFTVATLSLLSAMLPGPDFALVIKNTISHSRRAGFFTAFGIASAVMIHLTYCVLGIGLVISQSLLLFSIIKYIGAAYLIYIGINSLLAKNIPHVKGESDKKHKTSQSTLISFRQGFICNLFNPKATLFFLALFTVIIKPHTPLLLNVFYAVEIVIIISIWFCGLVLLLSHPHIMRLLDKSEKYISKALGIFLIGFGIALAFIKQ